MSGFGGFGGFGQGNSNQQQQQQPQSSGFGGFGSTNATNTDPKAAAILWQHMRISGSLESTLSRTGFGTNTNNTGFGSTGNTTGGLFGGGSSGFGNSGGFGSQQSSSPFGAAKPAFGAPASSAGGGIFGSNTATAGTGTGTGFGFGSGNNNNNNNNNNTASAFGSTGTTGGSLFGSTAKPAFGGGGATTFGAAQPFGSGTTGFGASTTGAATGECQGTGAVPFSATIEKEPNNSTNQQNSFQNICFQQPYQKFSPEELRLADYAQGRRHGQGTTGGTGAFGQSTGFGGFSGNSAPSGAFGNTNNATGGLFGSNSTGAFGQAQPASNAFGTNNAPSGGLFGAKPATGGLFGNNQTQAQPSAGLFGSTPSTGFGAANTNSGFGASSSGTSLFGNNNNNNQAKPGFSFGAAQPATTGTGTGFGTNTNTAGAFGNTGNTGSSLFSNNANNQAQQNANPFGTAQPAASSGLFGGFGNNNQQQAQSGTGSLFGGTNNQAKPATGGLFGNTNASATPSLFGNNNQQNNSNPFGGTQNSTTGGLFGSKPATNTGGLFGNPNSAPNAGGGLFGNNATNPNQQQQNTGTSLFGNLNNQQKPSLFGGQPQQNTGSLFGGNAGQQNTGSLFGGLNNSQNQQQQPTQSNFGGNLFGNSQPNQPQPQSLTASINDPTAFGTSMFSNLATPEIHNPGPIATPLSSLSKQKKPGVLPMYKLNPSSSISRGSGLYTPQRKGGFGFTYSTYGSPASASSTSSTPLNLGGSLLAGRGLSKSMSTSNLRGSSYTNSFNREDSLLAPGAFSVSPSTRFNSTGSMKKLVINRSIRSDLFSPPSKDSTVTSPGSSQTGILKKRVSFDTSTVGGNANGGLNGFSSPLKQVQNTANPTAEEMGFLRSPARSSNGIVSKTNGDSTQPEMEQIQGNELAIVPEEDAAAPVKASGQAVSVEDPEPGEYWMEPSKQEIMSMSRAQRSQVSNFTVGRNGIGQVKFRAPVDLNTVNLDDIYDKIVVLRIRSATVYPEDTKTPVPKPSMGKGLNVPAVIQLQNSWPRKDKNRRVNLEKSGPRFKKHLERLAAVKDTTFVNYDKDTGIWTFTVEHFTTYGLDDDETDGEGYSEFSQSTLSALPDSPTPQSTTPRAFRSDQSFASMSETIDSDPEDTFDFKKKRLLPGAFDDEALFVDDAELDGTPDDEERQSFLDERSTGSQSEDGIEEPMDQDDVSQDQELVRVEDQEMAGSYPHPDNSVERDESSSDGDAKHNPVMESGAVMRARLRAMRTSGSPLKRKLQLPDDDWAELLQQSVSPRKQDREQLKRVAELGGDRGLLMGSEEETRPTSRSRIVSDSRGFATSIDLMHSLFGDAKSPAKTAKAPVKAEGFEWPYPKATKTNDLEGEMDSIERDFHDSQKPSWGPTGTLVFAAPTNAHGLAKGSRRAREKDGLLVLQKGGIVSEGRDVRFANFSNESSSTALDKHKALSSFELVAGVPRATISSAFRFVDFFDDNNTRDAAGAHEKLVWELAGVLFDDIEVPDELSRVQNARDRLRKDNLAVFWQKLVEQASSQGVILAKSTEEKAIASLAGHKISEACRHLLSGKNFHLATLVALIGDNESTRIDIREQINEWQKSRILSEISQPIRALYEILAGNVSVCGGVKVAPIEDRIESFIISQRFGMNWRQAFALRLWYAILASDGLEKAVHQFSEDLKQEKETSRPRAWYVEESISPLWNDEKLEDREDLLWGLLKLYSDPKTDLESVLRPENSQLSPLDYRLSWQLSRALTAFDKCSYGLEGMEKADQLTLSFASQLTGEGSWLDATFVLLHLSSVGMRAKSIRDHLARHAERIGVEDKTTFKTLVQDFKLPAHWLWEAKALYMRSVQKDPRGEVEFLVRAGMYDEAHRTFRKEVAPTTVIERDWETLRTLLLSFKGKENDIAEWHLGGELYTDYLVLLDSRKTGWNAKNIQVLERLFASLPAMIGTGRDPNFMETVAVKEMSGVVAKTAIDMGQESNNKYLSRVLRMPLAEDNYLKHTVDLSIGYYKSVMATR
ncbi:MAG: hypothetical protein M1818_001056 [Claussenomyces sp. TS43310]|nr:MAG: hypothetical protein M1818_001056 [Claussenomyces sp. TS43310]